MDEQAQELLEAMLGAGAVFRPGQLEAIDSLVVRRKRVLVVQSTGWGKSLVYFIATKLLRDRGAGPTLLISPLLALMRNQLEATRRIGIRAAVLNSTNPGAWASIENALRKDEIDILLVSPEHLANSQFQLETLPAARRGIGLLVVDEAHCISDWGHDFRPDYRRIVHIVQHLPAGVPVLGTTATANDRVVADVSRQLGPNLDVLRGPLMRDSLQLQTINLADQAERLAWLAQHVPDLPGTGIIYCLTVADCKRVSGWLQKRGINAPAYYGDLANEEREELERRLLNNEVKALVATVALGMGFDKPDLGFVVHFQRPGSVVMYYQQIGRAGRAMQSAYAILLSGREDDEIQQYFIDSAFPTVEATLEVLRILDNADKLSLYGILAKTNLSRGIVERVVKLLEIDGAIAKEGRSYFRTPNAWQPDVRTTEDVTGQRMHELRRMQAFVTHLGCLMEFIARELDDPYVQPCGRCAQCIGELVPTTTPLALEQEASVYLSGDYQVIEPRKQWPVGILGYKGHIPEPYQLQEGRALSIYGDSGWGKLVQKGKYESNRFDDRLVDAMVQLIHQDWRPEPAPAWVTAVPSLRNPALVSDFATRLAGALGLPFRPLLSKVQQKAPQKEMQNSTHQAQNALESFQVAGSCPNTPVLLVDDIVDSRWTLVICGLLLRQAGSGPVFSCTLATAAVRGGLD